MPFMFEGNQDQQRSFSTSLEIIVFYRHQDLRGDEWAWRQEDIGPGYFHPGPDIDVGIRARQLDDHTLRQMVDEIHECQSLTFIDLSENRKLTNSGLYALKYLRNLQEINRNLLKEVFL